MTEHPSRVWKLRMWFLLESNDISTLSAETRVREIRRTHQTCPAKFENVQRRAIVKSNQMSGEKLEMSGEAQINFAIWKVVTIENPCDPPEPEDDKQSQSRLQTLIAGKCNVQCKRHDHNNRVQHLHFGLEKLETEGE